MLLELLTHSIQQLKRKSSVQCNQECQLKINSRTHLLCAFCLQIYYIWYGAWGNLNNNGTATRPTTVKVLTDMAQSIGGKPWFGTATTYSDNNGAVPNLVKYGGRAAITTRSSCWQARIPTTSCLMLKNISGLLRCAVCVLGNDGAE